MFFRWVQSVLVGLTGNVAEVSNNNELLVTMSTTGVITNNMNYESTADAPALAATFKRVASYTVPATYKAEIVSFNCRAGNIAGAARVSKRIIFGSYVSNTNVFTDNSSYISPEYAAILELAVTTALSAATTFTITYVNQSGVAGRTATAVFAAAAGIGVKVVATLQAGDIGVIDVTNVTDNSAATGVLSINGLTELFYQRMTTADLTYAQLTSRGSFTLKAGDILDLEIWATNTTNTTRKIGVTYSLTTA